jgi:hypothetical protein
LEKVFNGVLG